MNALPRLALLTAALLTLPACSHAQALVSMQIRDIDQNQLLPHYPSDGREYVAGQPGHRYAVELQNLTGQRVLVVVSIDGVNAISGQTASTGQSGYVLDPWQHMAVRGWRKDMSAVAEFQFTALGNSYAARTGRPDQVGVIGIAAFREQRPPEPVYRDSLASPAPTAPMAKAQHPAGAAAESSASAADSAHREASPAMAQQLGTGHGERRYDPASQTTFARESRYPNQTLSIYYDASEVLMARGIMPRPDVRIPEAFPISFVPDP